MIALRTLLGLAMLLVSVPAWAQAPTRVGPLSIQDLLGEIATSGAGAQATARANLGLSGVPLAIPTSPLLGGVPGAFVPVTIGAGLTLNGGVLGVNVAGGAFGTLAAQNAGAVAITGGTIAGTPISGSTGAFTGLSASGTVSGVGFTALLAPYAPLASPTFTGTVNGAAAALTGNATVGGTLGVTGALTATGGGALSGVYTGSPNFSGLPQFSGGQNWSATKNSAVNANLAFLSGVQTVNSATITGAFAPVNILQVSNRGISNVGGTSQAWYIQYNINGAGVLGGSKAIQADLNVVTTGNTGSQYSAIQGNFLSSTAENGSIGYGFNATSQLFSGASGWSQIVGGEINVGVATGASAVTIVTGVQVVPFGNWTVAGTSGIDTAYVVGYQPGAVGFDYAFRVSSTTSQFPVKTTGTLFATGSAATVTGGFDISSLTYTGNTWNDGHVTISGAGVIKTAKLNLAGISTTCAAQPTGSVAVVASVFTLCP